jgi:hypothetical protein
MQEIILIVAIFAGLACLIGTFARAVLLPTAKLGQRARGFSDQVVTEIAVALPLCLESGPEFMRGVPVGGSGA